MSFIPFVIHQVSWFCIQTSRYTSPVFELGPCDTVSGVEFCLCTQPELDILLNTRVI